MNYILSGRGQWEGFHYGDFSGGTEYPQEG